MRRPVLIANGSPLYAGGEFYVLVLAGELLRRGRDVAVACRPDNLLAAKCRDRGIPVETVDFP